MLGRARLYYADGAASPLGVTSRDPLSGPVPQVAHALGSREAAVVDMSGRQGELSHL